MSIGKMIFRQALPLFLAATLSAACAGAASAPSDSGDVAAMPQVESYGAIATGTPPPDTVRSGVCWNQATRDEAMACALEECGVGCEVKVTFGPGECGAFTESRRLRGAIGFGVSTSRYDAIGQSSIECRRSSGIDESCRLMILRCNG